MENVSRRKLRIHLLIAILLVSRAHLSWAQASTAFDIVITNGHILDGTGSPWYSGDLAIREGKLAAIGNLADAPPKKRAHWQRTGVAPVIIDLLGQSELTILVAPRLPSIIYQGITTE